MSRDATQRVAAYLELEPASSTNGSEGGTDPVAAVYVHFPFCRSRCGYCDFDTHAGLEELIAPYLEAVVSQIESSPPARATTLYVGGGTPSLMRPDQAARVVQACRERFGLSTDAEITLEANPSDLDRAKLEGFLSAGFNRLSLGVQSTDDALLRLLGRRHNREDAAMHAVDAARGAGFANVSVDLIYGVPHQDRSVWERTLRDVVGWGVQHVSCYMLSLESGTPLEGAVQRGELDLPSDEETAAMYAVARDSLAEAGYRRYEVSNWARPGFESAHNLTYWRNRPYLGIGAGAACCWRGRRYKIRPDIPVYIRGVQEGRLPLVEDEGVDPLRSMSETLILGLRLEEGVSREDFRDAYGVAPEEVFGEGLTWGEQMGLLVRTGDRLKLTEQGILLSNELFERLL